MNEQNNTYIRSEVEESQIAVYLAKVMGWMCVGLLTTFVAALLCLTSGSVIRLLTSSRFVFNSVLIAQILVAVGMRAAVNKITSTVATVLFMLYSALTGVALSLLGAMFQSSSIVQVFLLTAAVFLAMATYGFVTKKDLTRMGRLAMAALIGVLLAGLINLFLRSSGFDLFVSCIAVLVFIGLTAYDTQAIKSIYLSARSAGHEDDSEVIRKIAIFGALTLYLDFINLFLRLLRILGKRR